MELRDRIKPTPTMIIILIVTRRNEGALKTLVIATMQSNIRMIFDSFCSSEAFDPSILWSFGCLHNLGERSKWHDFRPIRCTYSAYVSTSDLSHEKKEEAPLPY